MNKPKFKLPLIQLSKSEFDKLPEFKTIKEGIEKSSDKPFKSLLENGRYVLLNNKTAFIIDIMPDKAVKSNRKGFKVTEPLKRVKAKIGANTLCPCGSNKKYKRCCK